MTDKRLIDNDQLNRIIRYNNAYQTIRITMLLHHIEAQADEITRLREAMSEVRDVCTRIDLCGKPANATAIGCGELLRHALDGTTP
jgi:hypothetical protein